MSHHQLPTPRHRLRRVMMRVLSATALTMALVTTTSAHAFEVKQTSAGATVHWPQKRVPLVVARSGDAAKDALLLHAARAAVRTWTARADVTIDIRQAGPDADLEVEYEQGRTNLSVIKWAEGQWDYDPQHEALTFMRYEVTTGAVVDADILVNDETFSWSDRLTTDGDPEMYDLQNTLTHEIGHVLGLADSTIEQATMFGGSAPADMTKRDLHEDDIGGVVALYGEVQVDQADGNRATPIAPPAAYGCSAGGPARSSSAFWVLFLLGALMFLGRARFRLARPIAVICLLATVALPVEASERGASQPEPSAAEAP